MKRDLMELLACPMCRSEELELMVLAESVEIDEGVIACGGCGRFMNCKVNYGRLMT